MSDASTKDKLRYADVNELVSDAITAMRRAQDIARAIDDRDLRDKAEDLIMNF